MLFRSVKKPPAEINHLPRKSCLSILQPVWSELRQQFQIKFLELKSEIVLRKVRVRRLLATGTMNPIVEEDKGINTYLKTRKIIHSCILCSVTTNVNFVCVK